MVDALVLGTNAERRKGSIPFSGTYSCGNTSIGRILLSKSGGVGSSPASHAKNALVMKSGRHGGLKIPCNASCVWVQVPPGAQLYFGRKADIGWPHLFAKQATGKPV